jgi:hypothetical protein
MFFFLKLLSHQYIIPWYRLSYPILTNKKDETLVISNGVTIQNSVSLAQCTTECRSNVKCCAASYSETTLDCHLDISGTCNFQKTTGSVTPLLITSVSSLYIVNVSSQNSERVVQIPSCRIKHIFQKQK